jgi:hypothetical protein
MAYPTMSIAGLTVSGGRRSLQPGSLWARPAPLTVDVVSSPATPQRVPMFTGFPIVLG